MLKRIVPLVLAVFCALALVSAASAARGMKLGIYDDAQSLGNTSPAFAQFSELRVQVVRVGLSWRAASPSKPGVGTFSSPESYTWGRYDAVVREAKARGMNVMFTILWTPGWAGGGATGNGNRAPTNMAWLQSFAIAAATRYSGTYPDPANPGAMLPRVRYWTAWNEPNAPLFLKPQYKFRNGRWMIWSGRVYAKMCSAVFRGVHRAEAVRGVPRGKVACGVTNPGGNNHPSGRRAAPTPIPFVRAMRTGRPTFDAYAHHPYPSSPSESPSEPPRVRARITLGNLGVLIRELNRLGWSTKRVWLTEYGYQTKPPDPLFGVIPTNQAAYMRQAYRIAKQNRRVDMFVWFLLKDELEVNRWQSGLIWSYGTRNGQKKPAYWAFRALRG